MNTICKFFGVVCLMSVISIFPSCNNQPKSTYPVIRIVTSEGDIDIELYTDKAPITANHFLQQVKVGSYKQAAFYRVLQSDPGGSYNTGIIQGGVYGVTVEVPKIKHEHTGVSGISHTDGIISMARTDPGTASSEFFICVGDQSPLDFGRRGTPDSLGMAAFGKVIQGMKTVKKIHNLSANGDRLIKPVEIRKVIEL